MRDPVPSGTRVWAIATLILSGLYLPLTGYGLFQSTQNPINSTEQGTIQFIVNIAQVLIALGFFVSSIAVLRGLAWGRTLMMHSSAAAVVTTVVGAAILIAIQNNPDYLKAVHDLIMQKLPPGNKLPADALEKLIGMQVRIGFYSGMIMGAIQCIYCGLLYRHMSQEPEALPAPAR